MREVKRIVAAVGVVSLATPAIAAENGVGFYLLGSHGTTAAVVPPPGYYIETDLYMYSASKSVTLPQAGNLDVGLKGNVALPLITAIWAPDGVDWGGARPFFTATVFAGSKSVDADARLSGPGGNVLKGNFSESDFLFGDPVVAAGVGGNSGRWFWSTTLSVNIPIGDYQKGRPTNLSFNHWGADGLLALTWLDEDSGWEASGALGMTVNAENPATDYRTGNEVHFEASVSKTTSSGWSFGLNGYHYQQVTGDSGDGAILGDFKGRVTGIGPMVAYATEWGNTPVQLRARYFHEFNEENRLVGDAVFLTAVFPIGL